MIEAMNRSAQATLLVIVKVSRLHRHTPQCTSTAAPQANSYPLPEDYKIDGHKPCFDLSTPQSGG